MKKINLEEILKQYNWKQLRFGKSAMKEAMKEVCRQILELAAENAKIIDDPNSYCGNTGSEYPPDQIVSKQSILDTINQIEL